MLQWDDLRFFIAAAHSGSFADAGRKLGADVATVSRRVARLETTIGATLFVRSPTGLRLTAIGRDMLDDCTKVDSAIARIRGPQSGSNLGGTIRISASEGFGGSILAPEIPAFLEQRPQLKIELAANAGFLSATQREVDIAVTLSAPNDSRLIVEPLTEYRLGLFASPAYLEKTKRLRTIDDLSDCKIVGYIDDLIYAPELRYLDEILPSLKPGISSTSIHAQQAIVRNGGGIGVLPYFLAKDLIQIFPKKISLTRRFWLSTHKEVVETARIRLVRNWMQDVCQRRSTEMLHFSGDVITTTKAAI